MTSPTSSTTSSTTTLYESPLPLPVDLITFSPSSSSSSSYNHSHSHSHAPSESSAITKSKRFTFRVITHGFSSSGGSSNNGMRSIRLEITDEGGGLGLGGIITPESLSLSPSPPPPPSSSHEDQYATDTSPSTSPLSLYFLQITEEDYPSLRADQSLLVDFDQFPSYLIGLLLSATPSQIVENSECDPYTLRLDSKPSSSSSSQSSSQVNQTLKFSILQSTKYKSLLHLSLPLTPPQPTQQSIYLSSRVNTLIHTSQTLSSTLVKSNHKFTELKDIYNALQNEKAALEAEGDRIARQVRIDLTDKSRLSEKTQAMEFRQLIASKEKEYKADCDNLKVEVSRLQGKLDESGGKVEDVLKQRYKAESEVDKLRSVILNLESKLESTVAQKEGSECKVTEYEMSSSKLREVNNQYILQIESLSLQTSKYGSTTKSSDHLRSLLEDKNTTLSARVKELDSQRSLLEGKVKIASSEIGKGNEIIGRLEDECRSYRSKWKKEKDENKKSAARNNDVTNNYDRQVLEITSLKKETVSLNTRNDNLEKDITNLTTKLQESAKLLSSNQQVITWLNREINESHIGPVGGGGGGGYNGSGGASTSFKPSFQSDLKVGGGNSGGGRGLGSYVSPDKDYSATVGGSERNGRGSSSGGGGGALW